MPAAGSGKRLGSETPKQYLPLLDKMVIEHTIQRLLSVPYIKGLILVLAKGDIYWHRSALAKQENIVCVEGGDERLFSVKKGLLKYQDMRLAVALNNEYGEWENIDDNPWILVHDAVRPCVKASEITKLIDSLWQHTVGGLLASPLVDTLKRVDGREVQATLDRSLYWRAQTPQMFKVKDLLKGINQAVDSGFLATDESSLVENMGLTPLVIEGSADNLKLTYKEDIPLLEAVLLKQNKQIVATDNNQGYVK